MDEPGETGFHEPGRRGEMERTMNLTWCVAALLLGACVLASGAFVAAGEGAKTATISGEVEPDQYDDEGEVSSVGISDGELGWVLIANTGKGKELLQHVGAMVTASGTIEEQDDEGETTYVMKVTSYTIDEPADPEDYPEDQDPEEED
jgi:hypothetical protein